MAFNDPHPGLGQTRTRSKSEPPVSAPPRSGGTRPRGGSLIGRARGLGFREGSELLSPRSEPLVPPRAPGRREGGGPQEPPPLDPQGGVPDPPQEVEEPTFNTGVWAELDRNKSIHKSPGDRTKVLAKLKKGEMVRRLPDPPQQKGGASWAKVRFRLPDRSIAEGWVKEHAVGATVTVENVDLTEPILPEGELPKPADVKQAGIGDCYLMAALVTTAQQRPQAIVDMFSPSPHDTAGETVGVRFFRIPPPTRPQDPLLERRVTVRRSLVRYVRPQGSQGDNSMLGQKRFTKGGAVWPAIIEKAYVAWPERNYHHGVNNAPTTYESIDGGHGADALEQITGQKHSRINLSTYDDTVPRGSGRYPQPLLDLYARIQDNLQRDGLLTVGTPQTWDGTELENAKQAKGFAGEPVRGGMAGKHEYAIIATSEKDGVKYVHVRNPWGEFGMKYQKLFGQVIGFKEIKGEKGCVTKIDLADLPKFFARIGATY